LHSYSFPPLILFSFSYSIVNPDLHSFPTRRSSDLRWHLRRRPDGESRCDAFRSHFVPAGDRAGTEGDGRDRHFPLHGQPAADCRSEEHTSELQSRGHLVCRLLLEKKKKKERTKVGM